MTIKDKIEHAAHNAVGAVMHPSDTAHHLADGAKHMAHDVSEKAKEVAHNAAQNAGNVAGSLAARAATSEAVHQIGGVAKAAIGAIEKLVE